MINPIRPISLISFTARKSEIRRADDILRKSAQEYPILSATKYYFIGNSVTKREFGWYEDAFRGISLDLDKQRYLIKEKQYDMCQKGYDDTTSNIVSILETVKRTKEGNCGECAFTALASLYANGYLNSRKASLFDKITIRNKETGNVLVELDKPLDHSAVITSMKKESKFDESKCDIVIDTWTGIADDKRNAIEKYKKIFKHAIERNKQDGFSIIRARHLMNEYEGDFNYDNYEVNSQLHFIADKESEDENVKKCSDYLKENFPNLITD